MQGFPGGVPDLAQLRATMHAVEEACSSIQIHVNPAEAERIIVALRESPMPYQSCRFILENSQLPNAKFQAAAVLKDAAIREWGIFTYENKRSLILFCMCYVMEHATAADGYVQSKISSVAAQLTKRAWNDFADAEKLIIFSEVKQAIVGIHGIDAQYSGINFLESLVSEFSLSTSTAMGLPAEFHEQCHSSFELNYLKEIYCWAQNATLSIADKIVASTATVSEDKVCSAAMRLMFQILNWNFKQTSGSLDLSSVKSSGIRHDTALLKNFERSLVQPGSAWCDVLISSNYTEWILHLYATLRQKYVDDKLWIDSPFAVSARQLIIQLCSLAGSVFPSDNGETQAKHLMQILSATVQWIDPPHSVIEAIRSRRSESEMLDGCHALLSIATLTSTELFDNLLRSLRPYGTLQLVSSITAEVVKAYTVSIDEEETWSSEALDILLEMWNMILGRTDFNKNSIPLEGTTAAADLFNCIVASHLTAHANSAFEDDDHTDHFLASILKRDERLRAFALIARAAIDVTVPFLTRLFSERFTLLIQSIGSTDPTCTLEELYWLLLITGHVLTDSGEGETVLVPDALLDGFLNVSEEGQHPVVVLSWSIIDFARQCLDSGMRTAVFSPRLMEAVIWFLARWVDTYLMPPDSAKGHIVTPSHDNGNMGSQLSKKVLLSFSGENNQGKLALDIIVRISMTTLNSYPGENELQALTCQQLLVALVRRKNVRGHLVSLDSWRDLANAFANKRTFFSLTARLQRSLAQSLVSAASGMRDPDAPNQYVKDLMGPVTTYLVDISTRHDLRVIAQQADVIFMISCLLERLRGATRATQPRSQKAIFEIGCAMMSSLLTFLDVYKNQSAVVYLILKYVVDLVNEQVAYLDAKDTAVLVSFCLKLLETYSAHNIGKISLTLSTSLLNNTQNEKYKDLRALLQLLTNICSKDLIDFSSSSDDAADSPDIAEVIYVGLHIVTPLISLDLLKYPKLSRDYFALVSHMLEVYPEKVAQLNKEAFAHIVATVEFGIHLQDSDIVDMCLRAVNALASYHFKERLSSKEGLGAHTINNNVLNGNLQEGILRHFLRVLLQLLLFEDFRMELAGSAADALLPLILCEQNVYQRLVHELLDSQQISTLRTRLANAFHSLTSSNQLASSLDRPNRHRFRKNLHAFLTEISGFMRIK